MFSDLHTLGIFEMSALCVVEGCWCAEQLYAKVVAKARQPCGGFSGSKRNNGTLLVLTRLSSAAEKARYFDDLVLVPRARIVPMQGTRSRATGVGESLLPEANVHHARER